MYKKSWISRLCMIWFASAMQLPDARLLTRWCFSNCNSSCFLKISAPNACSGEKRADRLSVRWHLGYDLDEPLPDHSTLSKIRLRYGLSVFRRFFEDIVEQCREAKLVWGNELYFDSTQVNANADLDSLTPRFAVEAREAIQEHLTALFTPEPAQLAKPEASSSDTPLPEHQPEDRFCAGPTPLPIVLSEAQHEELATENAARHDWIEEEGRQH